MPADQKAFLNTLSPKKLHATPQPAIYKPTESDDLSKNATQIAAAFDTNTNKDAFIIPQQHDQKMQSE